MKTKIEKLTHFELYLDLKINKFLNNNVKLTLVTMVNPTKKLTAQTVAVNHSLRLPYLKYPGNKSTIAVTKPCTATNWDPRPSNRIIRKNMTAQNEDQGIVATARGYAMKARPGPDSATSATVRPCSKAIYPSTEKMAKPA